MFVLCTDCTAMVNLERCAMVELEGRSVYASDSLPTQNGQCKSYKLLGSYSSEENAKEAFQDLQKAIREKKDEFAMSTLP